MRDLTWVVYSREVGVEVDTRSRMCHGGWEVWVQGVSAIIEIYDSVSTLWSVSSKAPLIFKYAIFVVLWGLPGHIYN